MSARKKTAKPKDHGTKKEPTPAQRERLNVRERCAIETGGKCQRCGSPKGSKLLSLRLCFQLVCAKCCGAHAAATRAAKADAKKKQAVLFAAEQMGRAS